MPICWKKTRNQTILLCARAYKNRPKRKYTSVLSSEQEMKAGFMVLTQEQSNTHPIGRVILLPSKRVEADEVRRQEHVACFCEQWASSSEGVFLQCQTVYQHFCIGVLRVITEAVGRKCPTSGRHRTGCCIMTTRNATRTHSFFRYLTKKRWWWYLASVLLHPSLHGLFWFSKIETWLKDED